MPDTSYEFLTSFFVYHLPFLPTPGQVELFQRDLSLVSPFLMRASLIEVVAGTHGNLLVYESREWRGAIFEVYNRKIAEHAQLFPVFHSFETAFRSTVAVSLERHYHDAKWWRAVRGRLIAGRPPHEAGNVSAVTMTRNAKYAIASVLRGIADSDAKGAKNGYEFLELCDLSHIARLIEAHWSIFSDRFRRYDKAGALISKLTLADFKAKFTRVRGARNDVYHHKSVARMGGVVATAEELLDYLDFSLSFVVEKIDACELQPLKFSIPLEDRHKIWKARTAR